MMTDNKRSGRPAYYFYRRALVREVFSWIDKLGFSFFTAGPDHLPAGVKVLVVNLGGVGDMILSEPLLSALLDWAPRQVDLVCYPAREESLLGTVKIHQVFNLELPWLGGRPPLFRSLVNLWRLSRRLRTEKYDLALDIKGDPAVIILLKLAGIRYRLGFSNGGLGFLLTHPFSQPQHLVRPRVDLALLAPLAGDFLIYERAPHLALTLDSNFLRTQANYRSGRPVISVHLGAGAPAKLWPLKYWLELLSSLAADYNIVVIGREGELNDLADLPEQLQAAFIKLIGRPWAETAQALANSALFIGADSGPGHLAAAVGCRVISIFSAANDPAEWAPAGARVLVFFPACAGCEKSVCSDLQCLRQITPAQVLAAAHEILLNYSGQNN